MAKSIKRRNQKAIENVGHNVRAYRKALNMTISEFAYTCELQDYQVSRIELGLTDGNITMLTLIAERLGVEVGDLFKSNYQTKSNSKTSYQKGTK